jgi:hypothetical protein
MEPLGERQHQRSQLSARANAAEHRLLWLAAPAEDDAPPAGDGVPPAGEDAGARGPDGGQQAAAANGSGPAPTGPVHRPGDLLSAKGRAAAWQQLAEFAELAHRRRVPSLSGNMEIGPDRSITLAVVEAMDGVIPAHPDGPGPVAELVLPAVELPGTDRAEVALPVVEVDGALCLDLTRTDGAGADGMPATVIGSAGRQDAASRDAASRDAASRDAGGRDAGGQDAGGQDAGGPELRVVRAAPIPPQARPASPIPPDPDAASAAAVIWGPACAIAGGPHLSVDALMSYARTHVFRAVRNGAAASAARGMHVARALEIVVLLDPALGGGLWIDVDPVTGRPAAILALDLALPGDEPGRVRATQLTTRPAG